jgi:hypothetical protein
MSRRAARGRRRPLSSSTNNAVRTRTRSQSSHVHLDPPYLVHYPIIMLTCKVRYLQDGRQRLPSTMQTLRVPSHSHLQN